MKKYLFVTWLLMMPMPVTLACTLAFTSPPNGTVFKTPNITVYGKGGANPEEGDSGHVSVTHNGTTIFNYSGSFTAATSFLRSRGFGITLTPGLNTLSASGSAGSCSASDSISIIYEPDELPVNNGASDNNTCQPMNIATGNKFFVQNVFSGSGVNPLKLTLFYNSSARDTLWTMNYRQSLRITAGIIRAQRPDGQTIDFTVDDGVISSPSQRADSLSFNGESYELTLADNTREQYDTEGRLREVRYPGGLPHSLSYNDNSITVTRHTHSLVLSLTDGNVDKVTLPDGSIISYVYDTTADVERLTTVIHADGTTRVYYYEDLRYPRYITGIQDENGNRISSVVYDEQGRAISSEKGALNTGIERTQISYNEDGSRTVTDALGRQRTYHFSEFNGEYKLTRVEGHASEDCVATDRAITYDANGFVASRTDFNGTLTSYINDTRGLETSRTEAVGTPQERTITTEWHDKFRLPIRITESGKVTTFTYDAQGRLLERKIAAE